MDYSNEQEAVVENGICIHLKLMEGESQSQPWRLSCSLCGGTGAGRLLSEGRACGPGDGCSREQQRLQTDQAECEISQVLRS